MYIHSNNEIDKRINVSKIANSISTMGDNSTAAGCNSRLITSFFKWYFSYSCSVCDDNRPGTASSRCPSASTELLGHFNVRLSAKNDSFAFVIGERTMTIIIIPAEIRSIRYDTIRDAILTCSEKLTRVGLI